MVEEATEADKTGWRRVKVWRGGWLTGLTTCAAMAVVGSIVLIRLVGDRHWAVVPLIYMPLWVFFVPTIGLLAVWAGRARRYRLWPALGLLMALVIGPLMGLKLPMGREGSAPGGGQVLRVMTFNRGDRGIDGEGLIQLIQRERVDLICFQEGGGNALLREFWKQGWYRTNFVASRFPIVSVLSPLSPDETVPADWWTRLEEVTVRLPSGREVKTVSVHLDTPRRTLWFLSAGQVALARKHATWRASELERVARYVGSLAGEPALIGGDFNMPEDSRVFRAMTRLYRSAFAAAGTGFGYTYPARLPWIRIDHLLVNDRWDVRRCWVGEGIGSDHLPLLAEVKLREQSARSSHERVSAKIGQGLECKNAPGKDPGGVQVAR